MIALACAAGVIACSSASAATVTLAGAWQVQSSALASQPGTQVSQPGFAASGWLAVTADDAGAPGTEIGALLQNGSCPDVFYAQEMRRCFGYSESIGPVGGIEFAVPWWFRTEFQAHLASGEHAQLIVNGIVGAADLWVDGQMLAGHQTLQGAYAAYQFDVTGLLHQGANALALEIQPNEPRQMLTLDDVDWNQIPPDNNTGIQFPLQLHTSGALALSDAHVLQSDAADLSSSALTVRATVTNNEPGPVSGTVSASISPPDGGAPIQLSRPVLLAARSQQQVTFSPAEYPQLTIEHPRVWWPYQLGGQPLYQLLVSAAAAGEAPDSQSEQFGIRTITSELVGASALAPHGVRRYLINDVPLVIRGGGWAEDEFLRYSAQNTAQQIALIENLGLNAIRTEGKQMPQDFYEQMDRAGILIDAGFQCCDAWQPPRGAGGVSAENYHVMYRSALSIGQALRDHPSVIGFGWSDAAPTRRQEAVSLRGLRQAQFEDPLIASAEYRGTPGLGYSGEKEGPYNWVPPSYWYDRSHYSHSDPTRTNAGGAWGFDSEASAGDTVPTMDSIESFMDGEEQEALWRRPDYNQYHTDYEAALPSRENGGYSFGTLFELDRAIAARFGAPSSLAQYVREAQLQNYETQRAEFEAYIDHAGAQPTPSTGVIYWMLNKGMPTLLWDLYNEEFDQAGSYFGAQEANRTVHALYAYDSGQVSVDNLGASAQTGLTVQARVYDLKGDLLDSSSAGPLTLAPGQVQLGVLTPRVPAATAPPQAASTYFVNLLLSRDGTIVDRNAYWLSTQPDVIDWPATVGYPQATMSQYADMTGLGTLPQASVTATASSAPAGGPAGSDTQTTVTITDAGDSPSLGLMLRADIVRAGGGEVLPVYWSSNDITLWPGETQTLTASYSSSALAAGQPLVRVSGFNAATFSVPAG